MSVNISPILEKCEFFSDTQVWTIEPAIKPDLWLSNFTKAELPYAENLLSNFFFYNAKMCKSMLQSAFQDISLYLPGVNVEQRVKSWDDLCKNAIFSTIDIDESNLTASGHLMCRKARQVLGIPEERFYKKEDALQRMYAGASKIIVFIDDFIGSGLQFTDTWTSPYMDKGKAMSYAEISAREGYQAYYLTLMATQYGLGEIAKSCSNIKIIAANVLDDRYSTISTSSILWPENLKSGAEEFIQNASNRAGIKNWKGFHNLALTVAFEHSVPDATLPLFYWNENGWKPLIERR